MRAHAQLHTHIYLETESLQSSPNCLLCRLVRETVPQVVSDSVAVFKLVEVILKSFLQRTHAQN